MTRRSRIISLRRRLASTLGPDHRTRVLCVHGGRVGSTVVGNMLNAHPEVLWDGELFAGVQNHPTRRVDPRRRIEGRMAWAGRRAYGFEIKLQQAQQLQWLDHDLPSFLQLVQDLRFTHYVLMTRRNLLRALVSWEVAQRRGVVHVRGPVPPLTRVHLSAVDGGGVELVERLDRAESAAAQARDALKGRAVLEIVYEDDVESDPCRAYARVCAFLGIPALPAIPDLTRGNPYAMRDVLLNHESVRSALSGSRFEWMLEDS